MRTGTSSATRARGSSGRRPARAASRPCRRAAESKSAWSRASTASADLDLAPITGDVEEDAFHDAVDDLEPNGHTAIGDALVAARDIFDAESDDRTQAILLLSDGENNEGSDPNAIIPELVHKHIIVYSVPLGGAADGQEMATIADQTGGESYDAETALELPTIYADLYARIRGETPLFTRTPFSVGPANPATGSLGRRRTCRFPWSPGARGSTSCSPTPTTFPAPGTPASS